MTTNTAPILTISIVTHSFGDIHVMIPAKTFSVYSLRRECIYLFFAGRTNQYSLFLYICRVSLSLQLKVMLHCLPKRKRYSLPPSLPSSSVPPH